MSTDVHHSEPVATALWCCSFELAGGGGVEAGVPWTPDLTSSRVLVRLHGEPMGYLPAEVTAGAVDVADLVRRSWSTFEPAITAHLSAEGVDGHPGVRPAAAGDRCPNRSVVDGPVSVIVCTRNRAEFLAVCLQGLTTLSYPLLEFVIVDNAATDDSSRTVVESFMATDPRFRYAAEPRPGLSRARNRGVAAATGDRLAFTDDDVVVDPGWIDGLLRGFRRRPDVGCVTGLAVTASVTTAAEAYFDARTSSWSTRFDPETFDLSAEQRRDRGPLYPYSPGVFGTGACCAFDRRLVLDLGGFDETLGAGAITRGGEDLDMFLRIVRAGRSIAYEPAALVWHHHRGDDAGLLKQMFGYGSGLSAFMTKLLVQAPTRGELLRRIPRGLAKMTRIRSDTARRLDDGISAPKGALIREFAGFAAGPALYWRAVRDGRPPAGHRATAATGTAAGPPT